MQLAVAALVDAHVQDWLDVSRTGTEGETVEGMQRTLSLALSGLRGLALFPCQQLRCSIRQDQAKRGNNQLRAAQSHWDPGQTASQDVSIMNPGGRKSFAQKEVRSEVQRSARGRTSPKPAPRDANAMGCEVGTASGKPRR